MDVKSNLTHDVDMTYLLMSKQDPFQLCHANSLSIKEAERPLRGS